MGIERDIRISACVYWMRVMDNESFTASKQSQTHYYKSSTTPQHVAYL